ncbi:MAG: hypothetical protein Q8L14_00040 [Myxococcales bacterium]|nr:hypothetical protein [Myxococcales bacterium]
MKTLVAASVLFAGLALADLPAPDQKPPEVVPQAAAPLHPEGIEKAGGGVISGGWEYVYAAYTLGTLGVLGFATSLFFRRPKAQPERAS